jgi:orotate phosphoribosyltransferase-like protein
MKGVDTIARIRREFFVRGKTIKEIVRELHVSRNTVRKVLRSGETAFGYEREVQPDQSSAAGQWISTTCWPATRPNLPASS